MFLKVVFFALIFPFFSNNIFAPNFFCAQQSHDTFIKQLASSLKVDFTNISLQGNDFFYNVRINKKMQGKSGKDQIDLFFCVAVEKNLFDLENPLFTDGITTKFRLCFKFFNILLKCPGNKGFLLQDGVVGYNPHNNCFVATLLSSPNHSWCKEIAISLHDLQKFSDLEIERKIRETPLMSAY